LVLPFIVRGGNGVVLVKYGVTLDAGAVGFDLVAVGFDSARFQGFPVVQADVRFSQEGYRAMFGWIQLVTTTSVESPVQESVSVDLAPFLIDEGSPMAFFGHLPTLFDAPANPDHPDGEWLSESFLVAAPDVARTRRLAAIAGFCWGYRLRAGRPEPLPLSAVGPDRWLIHHELLASQYPSWSFLEWSS
jgi:hypothetical protein